MPGSVFQGLTQEAVLGRVLGGEGTLSLSDPFLILRVGEICLTRYQVGSLIAYPLLPITRKGPTPSTDQGEPFVTQGLNTLDTGQADPRGAMVSRCVLWGSLDANNTHEGRSP